MKVIATLIICLLMVSCVSMTKEEYIAWTQANMEIAKANANMQSRPTFELQLTPDGKVSGIKTYASPVLIPYIDQKRPSEWVGTVNRLLSIGGTLGTTAIIGNAFKSIVNTVGNSAGHNTTTTITDSYNQTQNGDNIGRDYIRDSYNPQDSYNTDNSINDSYNPDNSINNSYNPINGTSGN